MVLIGESMKNQKRSKRIKPEYVDVLINIDGNLKYIGLSQFTNANYIVIANKKDNFTWTCSLDFTICKDGYMVKSLNKNGRFNVFRSATKKSEELDFDKFLKLFEDVVEIYEEDDDEYEEEEDELDD